jgi:hypothetical protein
VIKEPIHARNTAINPSKAPLKITLKRPEPELWRFGADWDWLAGPAKRGSPAGADRGWLAGADRGSLAGAKPRLV